MKVNQYIEHTLLKQDAKNEDFEKLFKEAIENKFWGVCVNPAYVKAAHKYLKGTRIKVVTVIGFPLGANTTETKVYETNDAIKNGADEIDMVLNVSKLKDGDYEYVLNDIKSVRFACLNHNLKVIIETDLLTKDEIKKACKLSVEAGANFVKTSTGFVKNGAGAKVEDVELMSEIVKPFGLEVKASGGIRDYDKAAALINAGASRLGTSSGVTIVSDKKYVK